MSILGVHGGRLEKEIQVKKTRWFIIEQEDRRGVEKKALQIEEIISRR